MTTLTISPIPAFSDNYIWLLHSSQEAFVVDPGEPEPVLNALSDIDASLNGILVTHHHYDHTGAVESLKESTGCTVWGPYDSPAGPYDKLLREGDTVSASEGALFCGDTLFVGGCGRVFEGSNKQMRASLEKLAALNGDSRVFCAHEYTLANLQFALRVEPQNQALQLAMKSCQAKRQRGEPTVPTTIAEERTYNPFLRWHSAEIRQVLMDEGLLEDDTHDGVFSAAREWKNRG
ncbi:MAG: hydroxyacylglutathione hydrolase C-terminal domain-containing protein [Gammaproteobacteria bacterium]